MSEFIDGLWIELSFTINCFHVSRLSSPFHTPRGISSPGSGKSLGADPTCLSITDEEKQKLIAEAANFSLDNRLQD